MDQDQIDLQIPSQNSAQLIEFADHALLKTALAFTYQHPKEQLLVKSDSLDSLVLAVLGFAAGQDTIDLILEKLRNKDENTDWLLQQLSQQTKTYNNKMNFQHAIITYFKSAQEKRGQIRPFSQRDRVQSVFSRLDSLQQTNPALTQLAKAGLLLVSELKSFDKQVLDVLKQKANLQIQGIQFSQQGVSIKVGENNIESFLQEEREIRQESEGEGQTLGDQLQDLQEGYKSEEDNKDKELEQKDPEQDLEQPAEQGQQIQIELNQANEIQNNQVKPVVDELIQSVQSQLKQKRPALHSDHEALSHHQQPIVTQVIPKKPSSPDQAQRIPQQNKSRPNSTAQAQSPIAKLQGLTKSELVVEQKRNNRNSVSEYEQTDEKIQQTPANSSRTATQPRTKKEDNYKCLIF